MDIIELNENHLTTYSNFILVDLPPKGMYRIYKFDNFMSTRDRKAYKEANKTFERARKSLIRAYGKEYVKTFIQTDNKSHYIRNY